MPYHEMNSVLTHHNSQSHTSSGRTAARHSIVASFCHAALKGMAIASTVAPTQDCVAVGVFGAGRGLKLRRHSPPTSRSEESAWRRAPPSKPPAGGGVCGGSDGAAAAAAAVTVSACRDAAIVQAALAPCSTAARTWGWGSAFG